MGKEEGVNGVGLRQDWKRRASEEGRWWDDRIG